MIRTPELVQNAVALRDVRTRMRNGSALSVLCLNVGILGLASAGLILWLHGEGPESPDNLGPRLWHLVALAQFCLLLTFVPATAATVVVGERERGVWDLLALTPMSSFGIVWGKFVSSLAFACLVFGTAIPFYSLALAYEGTSVGQLVATLLSTLAMAILLTSIAICVSTLATSSRRARPFAIIISVALVVFLSLSILSSPRNLTISFGTISVHAQFSRLALLDPLAGLIDAMPDGTSIPVAGQLAGVPTMSAWGFHLSLWALVALISVAASGLLLGLTTRIVSSRRFPPQFTTAP